MDPDALIYLGDCEGVSFEGNKVSDAGPVLKRLLEAALTATNVSGAESGVQKVANSK